MTSQPSVAEAAHEALAGADATGRPMRADARRNYERLLAAAREVFTENGPGASMEAIARRAGVGVGTLYRHFPRRIDIVEAVYRDDVDELTRTAERVVAELEPWPAVGAFFEAFVRYTQGKRMLLSELHEAFEKNPDLRVRSRERIDQAMQMVIGRAQEAREIRDDVDSADLLALLAPICTNSALSDEQTARLLKMILDGLRQRS